MRLPSDETTASQIRGATNATPHGFVNYTQREALGVCALIVPWNYPLMTTLRKLGPALAAGNTVVIKPASQSALSAIVMAELAVEAGRLSKEEAVEKLLDLRSEIDRDDD